MARIRSRILVLYVNSGFCVSQLNELQETFEKENFDDESGNNFALCFYEVESFSNEQILTLKKKSYNLEFFRRFRLSTDLYRHKKV